METKDEYNSTQEKRTKRSNEAISQTLFPLIFIQKYCTLRID
jgi:hypothetical protein